MPRRSVTPGRKFSSTTSAVAASRRNAEFCASSLRSSTTLRLLRLTARNAAVSSPRMRKPMAWRAWSPEPGGSTLMTSAPMSPRSWAQNEDREHLEPAREHEGAQEPQAARRDRGVVLGRADLAEARPDDVEACDDARHRGRRVDADPRHHDGAAGDDEDVEGEEREDALADLLREDPPADAQHLHGRRAHLALDLLRRRLAEEHHPDHLHAARRRARAAADEHEHEHHELSEGVPLLEV